MEKNKNLLRMNRMNADRTRGMVANILRSSVPLRFKGFAFALCFTPRLKASVVGFCFLIFGHFGNSLRCRQKYFSTLPVLRYNKSMTHQQLVRMAEQWLRTRYRCGIVLSEQSCASGETPDVIAWKGKCRSVVVECKLSRGDFFADQEKPFRKDPELGMGCERFYLVPQGLITADELPKKWGLLECKGRDVRMKLDDKQLMLDVEAAPAHLKGKKLAIVGYCFGGTVAWWGATRSHSFAAASCWYGGGIAGTKDEKPNCPVQMHFGETDASIPMTDVDAVRAAQPKVETYVYKGAGHGFGCNERASFSKPDYDLAQQRTLDFFAKHLG